MALSGVSRRKQIPSSNRFRILELGMGGHFLLQLGLAHFVNLHDRHVRVLLAVFDEHDSPARSGTGSGAARKFSAALPQSAISI
jgi:hypothetical protein